MTQHHITGSEAFGPGPHVQIRVGLRRRRMNPALKAYGLFGAIGLGAGLVDVVIGGPVMLIVALVGLTAWRFWPAA